MCHGNVTLTNNHYVHSSALAYSSVAVQSWVWGIRVRTEPCGGGRVVLKLEWEQQMSPAVGSLTGASAGVSKSRGLLSAPTSPAAPGNASHSSSWQSLGHFQQSAGKTQKDHFLEYLGSRVWSGPEEIDWKHMPVDSILESVVLCLLCFVLWTPPTRFARNTALFIVC